MDPIARVCACVFFFLQFIFIIMTLLNDPLHLHMGVVIAWLSTAHSCVPLDGHIDTTSFIHLIVYVT